MAEKASENLGTEDRFKLPFGPPFDPSFNVNALNEASNRRQDDLRFALQNYLEGMRTAESRFQDFAREAEARFNKVVSESEVRRLDQLADLRMVYETRIADMLRASVESSSTLVSSDIGSTLH